MGEVLETQAFYKLKYHNGKRFHVKVQLIDKKQELYKQKKVYENIKEFRLGIEQIKQ